MAQLKSIKDVHHRMLRRQAAISLPSNALPHTLKSIEVPDAFPNGKIERFIVTEHVGQYNAMRVVAAPEAIEQMADEMKRSGIYIDVFVTMKVER